ncbi:MAG: Spy/CpxP family protein refolding chaperone [Thermoanaerobaculia bacterium]
MKKRILLCAAFALTLATFADAAPPFPRGKWWRRPEIARQLALTDDQQTRLDASFRSAASELIDLRGETEKLSIALHSELDQPQLNRENLRKLAARLSDVQGKLFERELMMLVDMHSVLSSEQWSRLRTELDRERRPKIDDRGMAPRPRQ